MEKKFTKLQALKKLGYLEAYADNENWSKLREIAQSCEDIYFPYTREFGEYGLSIYINRFIWLSNSQLLECKVSIVKVLNDAFSFISKL